MKTAPDAPLLAIGIPTRGASPLEFWMCNLRLLSPLGLRSAYIFQKGMLPAAARNAILDRALTRGHRYLLFLDDDVLFPPFTAYRLWGWMRQHPEAAAITAVIPVKADPAEPMLYRRDGEGADWDWPLGELRVVRGAGAGCVLVDLDYVRKLAPPYFQDQQVLTAEGLTHTGHDRYFFDRLQDDAGGVVYADTGLLCGHFDVALDKVYLLPPTAPCFQRPLAGECWVPVQGSDGVMEWSRLLLPGGPDTFVGYIDWLKTQEPVVRTLLPTERLPGQILGAAA